MEPNEPIGHTTFIRNALMEHWRPFAGILTAVKAMRNECVVSRQCLPTPMPPTEMVCPRMAPNGIPSKVVFRLLVPFVLAIL